MLEVALLVGCHRLEAAADVRVRHDGDVIREEQRRHNAALDVRRDPAEQAVDEDEEAGLKKTGSRLSGPGAESTCCRWNCALTRWNVNLQPSLASVVGWLGSAHADTCRTMVPWAAASAGCGGWPMKALHRLDSDCTRSTGSCDGLAGSTMEDSGKNVEGDARLKAAHCSLLPPVAAAHSSAKQDCFASRCSWRHAAWAAAAAACLTVLRGSRYTLRCIRVSSM